MSIGGIMRTSVSGMNAQATRLSTVSENIANSDTTGYKQSQTEFSSLILPATGGGYNSGAVEAQVRTLISEQGGLSYTGNDKNPKKIDLAIEGTGFLAVGDGSGGTFLTRAGSFTQQADGTLVNAAGFILQGYPVSATGTDRVLNGFAGLSDVNLKTALLSANPTTQGTLTVPLNHDFVVPGTRAAFSQPDAVDGTGLANGESITFKIAVDGKPGISVRVDPASAGVKVQAADIIKAINDTGGLSGAASLVGGKIVLNSPGKASGVESTMALTDVTVVPVVVPPAVPVPVAAPTLKGFEEFGITDAVGVNAKRPSDNTKLVPSKNSTTSTSLTVYNNAGEAVKLDIHYTKIADNKWEMAVFDGRGASTGAAAPFPYGSDAISTAELTFDPGTYTLTDITALSGSNVSATGVLSINLTTIGGGSNFNLNLGGTTQYAGNTQPLEASVDGNPAEVIKDISIGKDGTITAAFASGTTRDLFRVPLAMVSSPDSMVAKAGNVYSAGIESGTVLMGFGGSAGFGNVTAGALEESTVDLASELTTMIESQRSYTANSKVFQTGSEILEVLVNLKR